AARRLAQDGPNRIRDRAPPAFWRRALEQLHDPLIYLMLAAAAISLAAWLAEDAEGWPVDAIVIGAIVLADALLPALQAARAQNAVAAPARLTAPPASAPREGPLPRAPPAPLVPRGPPL